MDRIRVLIVDDTKETVDLVRKVLNIEQDKFEIVGEASNGEEALELIPEAMPHIVLMDINMPVMNGLEATEKITSDFPSVAVVIMSVQGENEYLRKAMLCGAKEYIVKPFNYNTLLETIQNTYDKNKELLQLEMDNKQEDSDIGDFEGQEFFEDEEDGDLWGIEDDSTLEDSNSDTHEGKPRSLNVKNGYRAVSLTLPIGGAPRILQVGQWVDVVVYLNNPDLHEGSTGLSITLSQSCKVLDVDKSSNELYVTLNVLAHEVEKLVLAENSGRIKLVIKSETDQSKKKTEFISWETLT